MKNLKKLVIASFMLVIAFVAVVSSTYAWFTRGQEATVNNISIGVVDASKSLLIGRENGVWSRQVTVTPIGKMTPVTLRGTDADVFTKFQQLEWNDQLEPSLVDSKALHEEYVKASGSYDQDETYYTKSGNVYTQVTSSSSEDFAKYYVKDIKAVEYIKADATAFDAVNKEYYTLSNNVYSKVASPVEGAVADYYEKNPQYVGAGYIAFDLYFQITVDVATEWANTMIQMDVNDLRAWNFEDNVAAEANGNNERAMSSFRLAVIEAGTVNQIAKIISGQGVKTPAQGENAAVYYDGVYGAGDQFAATNGWLAMLNESDLNENNAVITKTTDFALASTYEDHASKNSTLQKTIDTTANVFEYEMSCGEGCNALIETSTDGLTKTFKVTILVWMEGWDGDNINAAANCEYYFGLSFRAI